MTEIFLNKMYTARGEDETREIYDAWAASYDTEIVDNGYATPARCAAALAQAAGDLSVPVLDFGCGTGLSGLALHGAGFQTIDGIDLSREMLAQAAQKGVYRSTMLGSADSIFDQDAYPLIAAIGVIGSGGAPVSVLHNLMSALPSGGHMVFSYNDHTLKDPVFEAGVCEWVDCGAARLLVRDYGDHLPGIGLKSTVYLLEKA